MKKALATLVLSVSALVSLTGCSSPVQTGTVMKVWAPLDPNPWTSSSNTYMLDVKLSSDGTMHTWTCDEASECNKLQAGDEIAFRVNAANSDYIFGVKRAVATPNR